MRIHRRGAVVAIGAAFIGATGEARAQSSSPPAPEPGRSRELQGVLAEADRLGFGGPRAAGTSDPLDLAELIDEALAKPATDEEAATLAIRSGLLLTELTRDEKDGREPDEPLPAARPGLTPTMEREYRDLFASAQIRSEAKSRLGRVARLITSPRAKESYKRVEEDTGVPWFVVGAIHYREANLNFMGHLHNGDPLLLRTVHVPERRPPAPWPIEGLSASDLWRKSAADALRGFTTSGRWSIPKIAFFLESYNGFGCRNHKIHSPYLWNFTQHYTKGGYPRDRFYSSDYVSKQAGLMAVIVATRELDGEVTLPG